MHLPAHVDQRLTDLEIKASFTEDLVDHLNRIVTRQQAQLDRLVREVTRLRAQPGPADAPPGGDPVA